MRRIPALDGLRGLAILSVLIWHYSHFYEPAPGSMGALVLPLFKTTWSGVDLFFVLSGFLIGGMLIDNRAAGNLWVVFYSRRALRIFPLYFVVLLSFLFLISAGAVLPWLLSNPLPTWSYATFTQNIKMGYENAFGANYLGPSWSLAVEEQFYLVAPFIIRYTAPRLLPRVLVALIAASWVVRIATYHWWSTDHYLSVYVLAPCRADALLSGVLCAAIVRSNRAISIIRGNLLAWRLGVTCLVAVTIVFSARYGSLYSRQMIFGGYTLLAMLYSTILLTSLIETRGPLIWLLTRRWLMGLGEIAFGVYLLHLIMLGFAYEWILGKSPEIATLSDVAAVFVAFAVTIGVSKLSWFAMERHLVGLGRRFTFTSSMPDRTILLPSDSLRA
jgi:peptidoglycan/LPS O-acetylase OafA/YrhL